jgi:uncharacterized protein with PIN domain
MTKDNKTQPDSEKRKCKLCGSTLRAIGKDRANGKVGRKGAFSDWSTRQYHKQCYKEVMLFKHLGAMRLHQHS